MATTTRRSVLTTLGTLFVGGCAGMGPGTVPGPIVEAPAVRVGDRWVYRGRDGFRAPVVWEETHDVTAVGPQGIRVRVTSRGPTVDNERFEQWAAPGVVVSGAVYDDETKTFVPPLVRYRYPLATGERWSQRMRDPDQPPGPYGGVSRTVLVSGYEKVTTPAGTFDAIRMRVFMRLDDETFWRHPTECNYLLWYAPAVGASVREEKNAEYAEKGGSRDLAKFRSQYAQLELISFRRGG